MTETIVYSSAADGACLSSSNTYSLARKGTGSMGGSSSWTTSNIGQNFVSPTSYCYQVFLAFDTSGIPDGDTIDTVVLALYSHADQSTTDFTIQARGFDWGPTWSTADFRSGDPADTGSLDEYTLLATRATSAGFAAASYHDLTSESAFTSYINKSGTTYLMLSSDRQLAGNAPSGGEHVSIRMSDYGSTEPRLTINHTAGTVSTSDPFGMSGFFGA